MANRYNEFNEKQIEVDNLLKAPAINFNKSDYNELLGDLQAGILKHHKRAKANYYFISFSADDNPEESKRRAAICLGNIANRITKAENQLHGQTLMNDDDMVVNVYLTHAGYQVLGFPEHLIPKEVAFKKGSNGRLRFDKSAIEKSWTNIQNQIQAILVFAHDELTDVSLDEQLKETLSEGEWNLVEGTYSVLYTEKGVLKSPAENPLNVKDGIGNPSYFPEATRIPTAKKDAEIALKIKKRMAMNAQGEKGYAELGTSLVGDLSGNFSYSHGSYGVFSKFEFNQTGIDTLLNQFNKDHQKDVEESLALIFGRFRNGTPLTLSDKEVDLPVNNFDYTEEMKTHDSSYVQSDSEGRRCPFFSHIRKANPRTESSKEVSITRRGMYYKDEKKE